MPVRLGLLALAAIAAGGCSRAQYRREADTDVRHLLQEKATDPRWDLAGFQMKADPRSRYFDQYRADCPPMPPDDPAAHRFMHYIDRKKAWPRWDDFGQRGLLENSNWQSRLGEYVQLNDRDEVVLSLDSAVTLALLHSPDYRQQMETIYLSALDVSTERFRFDVQFFGNTETTFAAAGDKRSAAGDQTTLTTANNLQLHKHLITGAELLVGVANTFVWQFAGPDTNQAFTLLNFNFVQPLLRAGGRAVALEQLTIAERVLLANLRAFERYRQGFFTGVAVGDAGVAGAQRRGGFFGGTGLTGFTGQGSGGFGGVGGATGFATGSFGGGGGAGGSGVGFAGGGAGTVGGFVGMLQQLQQVRNTEDNLDAQTRTLDVLEAYLAAGVIDIAQVDQFRQNIQTERANLLQAKNSLTNTLDNFKVATLGLPPDLPVALDDSLIEQFRFADPATAKVGDLLDDFIALVGDFPDGVSPAELNTATGTLDELRGRLGTRFAAAQADLEKLASIAEQRERTLDEADRQRFAADRAKLSQSVGDVQSRCEATAARIADIGEIPAADVGRKIDELIELARGLAGLTQELLLVQVRARLESVTMPHVDLAPERAIKIARANRLDWMNNRAALVDTWRLIEFNGNALEAGLDLVFSGELGTNRDNPVSFTGTNGVLRAGVRFDGPFTRLLERNNYRSVLISYQQDRRRLIQYQDQVYQGLRRALRQLDQLDTNLEIQRKAVAIAVERVDQTRETLNRPPEPAAAGQIAAPQFGPTAAQNLLTALSDLRNSQNNFMSVWLNHLAARMALARDLGVMQLDERGLWIERPLDQVDWMEEEECPLPPDVPRQWLDKAGLEPLPPGNSDFVDSRSSAEPDLSSRDRSAGPAVKRAGHSSGANERVARGGDGTQPKQRWVMPPRGLGSR